MIIQKLAEVSLKFNYLVDQYEFNCFSALLAYQGISRFYITINIPQLVDKIWNGKLLSKIIIVLKNLTNILKVILGSTIIQCLVHSFWLCIQKIIIVQRKGSETLIILQQETDFMSYKRFWNVILYRDASYFRTALPCVLQDVQAWWKKHCYTLKKAA